MEKFYFVRDEDKKLFDMLEKKDFLGDLDLDTLPLCSAAKHYEVSMPDEQYTFLHEAAVIEYHGVLYASWYNCGEKELIGRTPVRGKRSYDGGKTWTEHEILADDETGKIMYCPPVYGICDDKLYMFINEMSAPDKIHALNLYVLDEETEKFKMLWSRPIPFKLNTNVYKLPNGKLMMPGRFGELDEFVDIPAVLISDSGKIDAEWRLVKIEETHDLPDGERYEFTELCAIIDGERVYMFARNDRRYVSTVYISDDYCETWQGPFAHDIPYSGTKMYSGTLSGGRNYILGNPYPGRSKLQFLLSEPGSMKFSKGYTLQDGLSEQFGFGSWWHYPVAYEADGNLYVIYTVNLEKGRGAVISVMPINEI